MSMKPMPAYLEEAVKPFNSRTAMEEASRCLLCHDAPCSKACPAGTDPASFVMSLRFRNDKGAAETIRLNNPLGGICARVCPYDKLCEGACARCGIDKPIAIGRLQRFAADQETVYGMKVMETAPAVGKKVACIGAGPASLACAAVLAQAGVDVTIYEKNEKAGGLLTYGIIPSRLPNDIVAQELAHVEALGVKILLNTRVGKDISFADLKAQYDAVFLGIGLSTGKQLDVPGVELEGVEKAYDFLAKVKTADGKVEIGKEVVVIGGGDTAMDAATTAALLGAKTTLVYRRTMAEAPAHSQELEFTQSLGVSFLYGFKPVEILGENGKAVALKAAGVDGVSTLTIKADQIIMAVGQTCADPELTGADWGGSKGCVRAENGRTNIPGVYAGGDVVNGGETVVAAIAEGKLAAASILKDLEV